MILTTPDVNVVLMDFPSKKGNEMVVPNEDGSYTILINAGLNYESQLKAYEHAIIQKERESLEQQLKELKKAAHKSDQHPADSMLQKVRSVYDILISNNYTYVQKNEALKQIIDKIIYDRKNNSLKIYFFLYR